MRTILLLCILSLSAILSAQQVEGVWKSIDDETGEAKAHVKIFKKEDGKLYGEITDLLISTDDTLCDACPGDKNNQPLVGMEIIWDLEDQGDEYDDGEILDPETGKIYNCKLWLEDKDTLKVRGYLGFSMLGRSQTWHRVR